MTKFWTNKSIGLNYTIEYVNLIVGGVIIVPKLSMIGNYQSKIINNSTKQKNFLLKLVEILSAKNWLKSIKTFAKKN